VKVLLSQSGFNNQMSGIRDIQSMHPAMASEAKAGANGMSSAEAVRIVSDKFGPNAALAMKGYGASRETVYNWLRGWGHHPDPEMARPLEALKQGFGTPGFPENSRNKTGAGWLLPIQRSGEPRASGNPHWHGQNARPRVGARMAEITRIALGRSTPWSRPCSMSGRKNSHRQAFLNSSCPELSFQRFNEAKAMWVSSLQSLGAHKSTTLPFAETTTWRTASQTLPS